ncbi:hypothetical protein V8C86DRAFT_2718096, partial [Haematococcus lacustris]
MPLLQHLAELCHLLTLSLLLPPVGAHLRVRGRCVAMSPQQPDFYLCCTRCFTSVCGRTYLGGSCQIPSAAVAAG